MSETKYCPKLVNKQEVKAMMIGEGDCVVSYMSPCLRDKCVAYCDNYCREYQMQVDVATE